MVPLEGSSDEYPALFVWETPGDGNPTASLITKCDSSTEFVNKTKVNTLSKYSLMNQSKLVSYYM